MAEKAKLYEELEGGLVKCLVCERGCLLKPGEVGI
ncbi:MAG: AmmeMemoRadiSam system radical SAM enzyme, partial [Thaumarchaeota archaeon]